MTQRTTVIVIIVVALLALLGAIVTALLYQMQSGASFNGGFYHRPMTWMMRNYSKPSYRSLGERIYLTGTDARGNPIPNSMMGSGMMGYGMMGQWTMGCANCHRPSGKGGLTFPDGRVKSSDIRWRHLKKEYRSSATLRRAITDGIDHDGDEMSPYMPRWQMTDRQLDAVIDYLKTK